MDITQSQVDSLVEDVAYLEHEADALKYVIENVPYTKEPPAGRSIVETLLFLDHAQQEYYRKVIEDVFKSTRPINLNSYVDPKETFDPEEDDKKDVQKVLYKISKHRAALLNLMNNIQLIDWERNIKRGKYDLTLYDFTVEMVNKERRTLKEIADLVLTYQNDRRVQKELESRSQNG